MILALTGPRSEKNMQLHIVCVQVMLFLSFIKCINMCRECVSHYLISFLLSVI